MCATFLPTLLIFLWLIMLAAQAQFARLGGATLENRTSRCSIDPNASPWWELTVLPRIGETMARRIVAYRQASSATTQPPSRPAFECAGDLSDVKGIGPKTVQRLRPYLTFKR